MSGVEIDFSLGFDFTIPVFCAASKGRGQILRLLLESGADREAKFAKLKETPLEVALKNNHADCVDVLMQFYPEITNWKEQRLAKIYPKLLDYKQMSE